MVSTLYQLCLITLIYQSCDIVDLHGIPFDPYILDLLTFAVCDTHQLFNPLHQRQRLDPLQSLKTKSKTIDLRNLLARIADAHGSEIRRPKYLHFGSLHLVDSGVHQIPAQLSYLSRHGVPQFITRLDLSISWVGDDDIPCLKHMVNLVVLDLTSTKVTDYGVSHLMRFTQLDEPTIGLRHLRILSLAYNKNITDGCLKSIRNMTELCGIDLSFTNVTKSVAIFCLKAFDYICNDDHHHPSATLPATIQQQCLLNTNFEQHHYSDIRRTLCPPHPLTLITYGDSSTGYGLKASMDPDISQACHVMKADNLTYWLLGMDQKFTIFFGDKGDGSWQPWLEKQNQHVPLVFTRSMATVLVGGKRPLATSPVNSSRSKRPTTLKGPLQVKHSQDAMSFINDFQW
ncbi:hypothetical protein BC941DRAFT_422567 [Chlamydoabsidia padenii]|nr:hypothetical protein BC941DRAFT_422567 [Chlamydoabsidia padenii]